MRRLTGPEMVPLPNKSPGIMLQPVTVWCTSCWRIFQYMNLKFERVIAAGAGIPSPWIATCAIKAIHYKHCVCCIAYSTTSKQKQAPITNSGKNVFTSYRYIYTKTRYRIDF